MQPNQDNSRAVHVLKEIFLAPDEVSSREGAVFCSRTYAVACAITAGLVIPEDGFRRTIEAANPGETLVTFLLEDRDDITFAPVEGETVTTKQLLRRLEDSEWSKQNSDHPLAFAYWAVRNYVALVKAIRSEKPLMMFRNKHNRAYVVVGGDDEENRFILSRAGYSPSEIEKILSTLNQSIEQQP